MHTRTHKHRQLWSNPLNVVKSKSDSPCKSVIVDKLTNKQIVIIGSHIDSMIEFKQTNADSYDQIL